MSFYRNVLIVPQGRGYYRYVYNKFRALFTIALNLGIHYFLQALCSN